MKHDPSGYWGQLGLKGDVQGHPFRGNQYTEGTGGEGGSYGSIASTIEEAKDQAKYLFGSNFEQRSRGFWWGGTDSSKIEDQAKEAGFTLRATRNYPGGAWVRWYQDKDNNALHLYKEGAMTSALFVPANWHKFRGDAKQ